MLPLRAKVSLRATSHSQPCPAQLGPCRSVRWSCHPCSEWLPCQSQPTGHRHRPPLSQLVERVFVPFDKLRVQPPRPEPVEGCRPCSSRERSESGQSWIVATRHTAQERGPADHSGPRHWGIRAAHRPDWTKGRGWGRVGDGRVGPSNRLPLEEQASPADHNDSPPSGFGGGGPRVCCRWGRGRPAGRSGVAQWPGPSDGNGFISCW